jgi:hypothetical protein
MKRKLVFEIDCGEKTCCCPKSHKFCEYMYVSLCGNFVCQKFLNDYHDNELFDDKGIRSGNGWLQRMPDCIKSELKK